MVDFNLQPCSSWYFLLPKYHKYLWLYHTILAHDNVSYVAHWYGLRGRDVNKAGSFKAKAKAKARVKAKVEFNSYGL